MVNLAAKLVLAPLITSRENDHVEPILKYIFIFRRTLFSRAGFDCSARGGVLSIDPGSTSRGKRSESR